MQHPRRKPLKKATFWSLYAVSGFLELRHLLQTGKGEKKKGKKEGKELPKSHQCQQPAHFPSERDSEFRRAHPPSARGGIVPATLHTALLIVMAWDRNCSQGEGEGKCFMVHTDFFGGSAEIRLVLKVWFLTRNRMLVGLLQLHLPSRAVWMVRAGKVIQAKTLIVLFEHCKSLQNSCLDTVDRTCQWLTDFSVLVF